MGRNRSWLPLEATEADLGVDWTSLAGWSFINSIDDRHLIST